MKDTTVIAYHAGCYGTYLEWLLSVLTTDTKVSNPFTSFGSSHQFEGNHLGAITGWQNYVKSNYEYRYARLHPKINKHESVADNINAIASEAKNVIYLYPTENTLLLTLNNQLIKVDTTGLSIDNWWKNKFNSEISPDVIYNNWNISKNTSINDIPNWIKREFLSLYLIPMWFAQLEWGSLEKLNCHTIFVDNLLYNFSHTVESLIDVIGASQHKDIKNVALYHQYNLSLQTNINQDFLCKTIIDSIMNNTNYNWDALTLASEAYIQWQLRNLGYEIKCDGLDIFPTNSLQLADLLYKT